MFRKAWVPLIALVLVALVVWRRGSSAPGRAIRKVVATQDDEAAAPSRVANEMAAEHVDPAQDRFAIDGFVAMPDGKPAEGAEVTIDAAPEIHAITRDDGSFDTAGLPSRTYELVARKGALSAGPLRVGPADARESIHLRLHAAPVVVVHVTDARSGQPVAGASVQLAQGRVVGGVSDGNGDARLQAGVPGTATLSVKAEGYAPSWRALTLASLEGGTSTYAVRLEHGAAAAGRVVDELDRGVRGARVVPYAAAQIFPGAIDAVATVTDADGRWKIPSLAPGVYRFSATAPTSAPSESAPVTIDARGVDGVVVRLLDAGHLSGLVVRDDGSPAGFATLRIVPARAGSARADVTQVVADENGAFNADGLRREPLEVVALHGEASSRVHRFDLSASASVSGARVTLDPARTITGVVVTSRGDPAPGVYVVALASGTDGRFATDSAVGVRAATSRPDGRFVVGGLGARRYTLRAFFGPEDATRSATLQRGGVDVAPGARDIRLVVPSNGGVTGQVRMSGGGDLGRCLVRTDGTATTAFDSERFRLDGVSEGPHTLTVSGAGFATKTVDFELAADELLDVGVILVDQGRRVSGRVVDLRGNAVAGAQVFAGDTLVGDASTLADATLRDAQRIRSAISGPDGAFTVTGLSDVATAIAAEAAEGRSVPQAPPPDGLSVDLVLQPSGLVSGSVISTSGPVAGAMVTLLFGDTGTQVGSVLATTSGPDGRYAFADVPPGRYRAFVAIGDGGESDQRILARKDVSVTFEAPLELDFAVQTTGVLLVVDADPARDVSLRGAELILSGTSTYMQTIGMAGSPSITGVSPGEYTLCALPRAIGSATAPPEPRCQPVLVGGSPDTQEVALQ